LSGFVGLTPTIRIVVLNPLLKKKYPEEGQALAVVDTGYEGFMALPRDIFESLSFNELRLEKRKLILANGGVLRSEGTFGGFSTPELPFSVDGFIEAYEGLGEILLGVEAISGTRMLLDYCNRRMKVEACS
jgi:clan AA aspartic protease